MGATSAAQCIDHTLSKKKEGLWVCAGPESAQGRRPRPGAHYDAEGWRVSRVCTVSIYGWWDRGDGQPQPGQSITSWQWLSHATSGVVVMANSQSAWLGAVRATQGRWQWHHSSRCPALSGTTVCIQTRAVRVFHLHVFFFNEISGLLFVVLQLYCSVGVCC